MIYYFSGTGNSRWVAEQLALKTNDIAADLIQSGDAPTIEGQVVGVVFPIYAWGAPEPVLAFVKGLDGKPAFAFGVCTCGEEAGKAMEHLHKTFPMDSTYSVTMPSNYILGADTETPASIQKKITDAKARLDTMAAQISARQAVKVVDQGSFPRIKSSLIRYSFNRFARTTRPFYVTDRCISCGQCAEQCPTQTIRLIAGKPNWGSKCYQCTACINGCPVEAIEYGRSTASRTRYLFAKHWPGE